MVREFIEWNRKNNIGIQANNELFFINERVVLKPDYILNDKIFVSLVTDDKLATEHIQSYEQFSSSYGTLIVIPYKIIGSLNNYTKADLEEHFNIAI